MSSYVLLVNKAAEVNNRLKRELGVYNIAVAANVADGCLTWFEVNPENGTPIRSLAESEVPEEALNLTFPNPPPDTKEEPYEVRRIFNSWQIIQGDYVAKFGLYFTREEAEQEAERLNREEVIEKYLNLLSLVEEQECAWPKTGAELQRFRADCSRLDQLGEQLEGMGVTIVEEGSEEWWHSGSKPPRSLDDRYPGWQGEL